MRNLDLIRLFGFYLAMAFLLSTYLRIRQYEAVVRLVRAVPERWPNLFRLVRQYHMVFLTWSTVLPAFLTLLLWLLHTLAYYVLLPEAEDHLSIGKLMHMPVALGFVAATGVAMLAFDGYSTFVVSEVDRVLLEKYFDQAEYWLRSWVAPVVNVFTFGRINPRRMVAEEVQKALVHASQLLNTTLWWVAVQLGLRIAFGLSLWQSYALS